MVSPIAGATCLDRPCRSARLQAFWYHCLSLTGLWPTRRGDQDYLCRDAIGFPAVHQARQPFLIARLEEITRVRCANHPWRVPHLTFHNSNPGRMGHQHLLSNHNAGLPSAQTHHGSFGAGADTPDPIRGALGSWSSPSRPAYTWESIPSRGRAVASWGVLVGWGVDA
jgi:hypothetical protein